MDGHYIGGVGDHDTAAEIVAIPEAVEVANKYLEAEVGWEARERVQRVAQLIEGFETPYGMELLATVHWVVTREGRGRSAEDAATAVHAWNDRKRSILQMPHIAMAWRKLKKNGWISEREVVRRRSG